MAKRAFISMIFMAMAGAARETPMLFSNLAKAHVSYDQFKLIYHANISMPYQMEEKIRAIMEKAREACDRTSQDQCKGTVEQLQRLIDEEKEEFRQIEAYGKFHRNKRALCEWCGSLQHLLYGVMDAKTAREYETKINQLQNETLIQHDLMRNQARIAQTSLELDTRALRSLDKRSALLAKQLKGVAEKMGNDELEELYRSFSGLINLMLTQQRQATDKIKTALMEARTGKIPELISVDQLTGDIREIQKGLEPDQALPIDFNGEPTTNIFSYTTTMGGAWLEIFFNAAISSRANELANMLECTEKVCITVKHVNSGDANDICHIVKS